MGRQEEREPAVEVEPLAAPDRVELTADRLLWVVRRADRAQHVPVPRGLLDRFVALRSPAWPGRPESSMPPGVGDPMRFRLLPDARVATFARQHGVFAICRHGLPTTHAPLAHSPVWYGRQAFPQVTGCLPLGAMDEGFQRSMAVDPVDSAPSSVAGWEPIVYWRKTARMLYSVLHIASAPHDRTSDVQRLAWSHLATWPPSVLPAEPVEHAAALTGVPQAILESTLPPTLKAALKARPHAWPWALTPKPDWDLATREQLYGDRYRQERVVPERDQAEIPALASWTTSAAIAQAMLNRYVEGLLALAGPRLTHRGERTRSAVLTTDGLFGALVLQLLLRLRGSTGFAICFGCGQIYTPWRRPADGSPSYCALCRRGPGNAERQRRLRQRRRLIPLVR